MNGKAQPLLVPTKTLGRAREEPGGALDMPLGGRCHSVVESVPSMHEALGPYPQLQTTKGSYIIHLDMLGPSR